MTTTVKVKARAWGATVEANGETFELSPNSERNFDIGEGESTTLTVTHGEKPADEQVPGQAQNDALIQPVSQDRVNQANGTTNETGATETALTTDASAVDTAATARPKPARG